MDKKGVSLIELNIGVAIAGILLAVSFISFENWKARYNVEKATKELYADFMNARLRAMDRNLEYHLIIDTLSSSYSVYEDRDDDGSAEPEERLPGFPKKSEYRLNCNGAGTMKNFTFDRRGIISIERTAWLAEAFEADVDCLRISRMRITWGKFAGLDGDGNPICEIR